MKAPPKVELEKPAPRSHKSAGPGGSEQLVSIVTPAYNEADNLPLLYDRLVQVLGSAKVNWELIIVDDHSSDNTFQVAAAIANRDARVKALRLARNYGSHTALVCGIDHASGKASIVMAADLQDPPEVIPQLLTKWRDGARVVWAVRAGREGETVRTVGFARLYYWLMRRVVGIKEMPVTGADFFLIDERVAESLRQFNEKNVSLFALISWMGFRQATISYVKQARVRGKSGWTLEKKLKLVVDSITSFTYLPVRLMSYLGLCVALPGFIYAGVVIVNGLRGKPPEGWASLMVVVLVLGGFQMLMLGVLGEYLWRSLDEARRRPRYLIEAASDDAENCLETDQ
jgi:glycosyltransferase involved in cell wall biosynthesis